jgi:hypothetical protein
MLGVLGLECQPCFGVLLYSTATRNTTKPGSSDGGPAWDLEGTWGSFLGTPIGSQYFMTAAHVGGNTSMTLGLGGTNYSIDATFGGGTGYVVQGDLALWKINGTFPAWSAVYGSRDELGQAITVIGRGTTRGADVTVSSGPYAGLKGWQGGTRDGVQSWGQNVVSDTPNITEGSTSGDTLAFNFDANGIANECSLSTGDSGGGEFIDHNGTWALAGISWTVTSPYSTAADGSNSFNAAIFDQTGLYVQNSDGVWAAGADPSTGTSYGSRISSHMTWLESYVPDLTVVPEPASLVLWAGFLPIGAAWLSRLGRRRRAA